jgi:ribonuclease BN (tRNA processing enzyme)
MTRLTVLGSCGAWPEPGRACTGLLLSHNGFHLVIDLGYGTASRLLTQIAARDVGAVVITHEHPDHMADLSALGRAWHYTVQAPPAQPDPDESARRGQDAEPPPLLPLFCTPGTLRRLEAMEPRPHPTTIFDVQDLSSGPAHAANRGLDSGRQPGPGPEHGAPQQHRAKREHGAALELRSQQEPGPRPAHSSSRQPHVERQPSPEAEHTSPQRPRMKRQPGPGTEHTPAQQPHMERQPSPEPEHTSPRQPQPAPEPPHGSPQQSRTERENPAAQELGPGWDVGPFRLTSVLLPHHVPNHGVRLSTPGLSVVYSGDCGPSRLLVELARDADLLICDATLQGEPPLDEPRQLMTAAEAGRAAAEAKVGTLLLTHFWPGTDRAVSMAEARAEFTGDVLVADEGLTLTM